MEGEAMTAGRWDRVPLGETCPRCLRLAQLVVGRAQAFCGNDECDVFVWDPTSTREEFEADATVVDLTDVPNPDRRPS
jgi:hypothetical protein